MVKPSVKWRGPLPAALILFACPGNTRNQGAGGSSGGASPPVVAVSILPQSWFVSRIAGGRARVFVLAGPAMVHIEACFAVNS